MFEFYMKKVHIIDSLGRELEGIVEDYFSPEDNESGSESIMVKTRSASIEIKIEDIQTIEIVS